MAGKPQGDSTMDTLVTFRISKKLKAQSEAIARADRRSLGQWLRVLIENEVGRKQG